MKQILTILLAANLLLACNAGNEKEKTTTTAPAAETHADHGEQATELALNNGEKWKADSTTLQNVALLQKIVSGTKQENLENHLKIAASLQDGLNKMVSECKMKGADHEALHHWLEHKVLHYLTSHNRLTSAGHHIRRKIFGKGGGE